MSARRSRKSKNFHNNVVQLNNYLPERIKLKVTNENNNINDLIMYVEPLKNLGYIQQQIQYFILS